MALHFYDTRHKRKVSFEPLVSGEVRLYTCGPTVYNDAHIGNLRTYMFEDLLRRTLKFLGFKVVQVMNLTDIDDKTIRQSRESGINLKELATPIIARFFSDLDRLGIERAEHYPAATDHIQEMIALVQKLLEKGYAYRAENNVYFSIERFADYGKLSGMNLKALARGVRIDADEYEDKENFRDFALWKGWTPDDGDVVWDAPFGRGRPGWSIECSAMSMKYLGEDFDIHTGGEDNIFPHHENEIAQSVAATGKGFARFWLHSAHLMVDGEKMSKSLGNFYTLSDLLKQGHSPRTLRYVLLTTHYRLQLNFTESALRSAGSSLERLDTLYQVAVTASGPGEVRGNLIDIIGSARKGFTQSLEDDLGIAGAMAALFDFVSAVHRRDRTVRLNAAEGEAVLSFWKDADQVFGVLLPTPAELSEAVETLVHERMVMRRERKFEEADQIRRGLADEGYQIEDGKEGTLVIWKEGRVIISF